MPVATSAITVQVQTRYLWWVRAVVRLAGVIVRFAPAVLPTPLALALCDALLWLAVFQLRIDGGKMLTTRWRWHSLGQLYRTPRRTNGGVA